MPERHIEIPVESPPPGADWEYTKVAARALKDSPFYEEARPDAGELSKFKNRFMISRDTPIQGGVYVGGSKEAIVVDEKYGALLPIYEALLHRRKEAALQGKGSKEGLLEDVWALSQEKLPYDKQTVEQIEHEFVTHDNTKVSLDTYINADGGVCRHQALLAAWLLEKLVLSGQINGHVSVDRNYIPGVGGHAWVRYTNSRGQVFIIDPAQKYIGALHESDPTTRWFYERPEDQVKARAA